MGKLSLYLAMSKDGYISGPNDDLSFLNPYQIEGEDYGYSTFMDQVDSIVVGRKTYQWVVSQGYPYHDEKNVFVISKDSRTLPNPNHHYYSGELNRLIKELKESTSRIVYCDGGAILAKSLLKQGLIDEIIISVIPTHLGSGVELFVEGEIPKNFKQVNKQEFKSGLTQFQFKKI